MVYFSTTPSPLPTVKNVFAMVVLKLSGMDLVYYHIFYIEIIEGMFFNNFSPLDKITVAFVRKLSGIWFIFYRAIFIQVIGDTAFNNFSPFGQIYLGVCM